MSGTGPGHTVGQSHHHDGAGHEVAMNMSKLQHLTYRMSERGKTALPYDEKGSFYHCIQLDEGR